MYNDYMDNLFDRKPENESPRQMAQQMPLPQPSTEVGKIYMYDVRRGDNVYAIARRFNTTADLIKHMNQLGPNLSLRVGQNLLIPVLYKTPQPQPMPQPPRPQPPRPQPPRPQPMPQPPRPQPPRPQPPRPQPPRPQPQPPRPQPRAELQSQQTPPAMPQQRLMPQGMPPQQAFVSQPMPQQQLIPQPMPQPPRPKSRQSYDLYF